MRLSLRPPQHPPLPAQCIPWAFTDLLAAAVCFLPNALNGLSLADRRARRRALARALDLARPAAATWQAEARALIAAGADVIDGRAATVPAEAIRAAVDVFWPDPRAQQWLQRKDLT
jgi:hypothetical protein